MGRKGYSAEVEGVWRAAAGRAGEAPLSLGGPGLKSFVLCQERRLKPRAPFGRLLLGPRELTLVSCTQEQLLVPCMQQAQYFTKGWVAVRDEQRPPTYLTDGGVTKRACMQCAHMRFYSRRGESKTMLGSS